MGMKIPIEISYRGLEPSPAIEDAIHKRVAKLEKRFGRIMTCRVSVEAPHQRHRRGTRYRVRIDLTVPGAELVAGRAHEIDGAHEDVQVAIRDAFRACSRQLQDQVRVRRGDVKTRSGAEA
jgi:ribosome-associated translation inhibitor RaiA